MCLKRRPRWKGRRKCLMTFSQNSQSKVGYGPEDSDCDRNRGNADRSGARVYDFRQILHNFDDAACVRILESQTPALGPDSVVVIDDKVLPDGKPPATTPGVEYTAALSIAMKVMFDAQERRETHWRWLLNQAGLQAKDIRTFTRFDDAVIIAAKKA